jgi:hypothetical protein
MARLDENNHAWYTAKCHVTPEGAFSFEFDYDHLPAFDIAPSPSKWVDEFKHYPRPALQAQVQDWIDGTMAVDDFVRRLANLHQPAQHA